MYFFISILLLVLLPSFIFYFLSISLLIFTVYFQMMSAGGPQ